MLSDLIRYYPGYTLDTAADELTSEQLQILLERAYKRPWGYSVMVEPKDHR